MVLGFVSPLVVLEIPVSNPGLDPSLLTITQRFQVKGSFQLLIAHSNVSAAAFFILLFALV